MNASQRFCIRVSFPPKAPACQSLAGRDLLIFCFYNLVSQEHRALDLLSAGDFYLTQGKSSGLDLNAVPYAKLIT